MMPSAVFLDCRSEGMKWRSGVVLSPPAWCMQARHCYTRYNEYHRCVAQKGEGADECRVFQRAYRSLCPGEWLERWNEQREEGTWPGRY